LYQSRYHNQSRRSGASEVNSTRDGAPSQAALFGILHIHSLREKKFLEQIQITFALQTLLVIADTINSQSQWKKFHFRFFLLFHFSLEKFLSSKSEIKKEKKKLSAE
jgi:hypothetical protein